jgi:hypothetical protein
MAKNITPKEQTVAENLLQAHVKTSAGTTEILV